MGDSHNKPIIEKTGENIDLTVPHFNKTDFDNAVFEHGYDVTLEKAIKCPCRIEANNNGHPDCVNCGGSGWLFVNKRSTVIVSQSMNINTKFKTWSEEDRGTISVSNRPQDRLSFMDRITILDLESTYTEVVKVKKYKKKYLAPLIYYPNSVEFAYMFTDSKEKLVPLKHEEDFTVKNNILELNKDKFSSHFLNHDTISVSIRYIHNPSYHVIDIPRERTADRRAQVSKTSCKLDDGIPKQKPQLVINAIARKAQYAIDRPNLEGIGLLDNSFIENSDEVKTNCDLVNERLSESEKISCILPRFDFKKNEVLEALSDEQITDLILFLNSSDSLDFFFNNDNVIVHKILSGEEGTYRTSNWFGSVSNATFKKNGNTVVLPVSLSVGDEIEVSITRGSQTTEDSVKMNR